MPIAAASDAPAMRRLMDEVIGPSISCGLRWRSPPVSIQRGRRDNPPGITREVPESIEGRSHEVLTRTRQAPSMAATRVLLVEDEENLRSMLEAALRYSGFETTSTACGREALDLAVSDEPDLILLDVCLPDLDGFEVCRRLKAAGSTVPIVFVSGRGAIEDKVRGLTIGGDDYLVKPFSLEELVARVGSVLRRSRLGARRAPRVRRSGDRRRWSRRHSRRGGDPAHPDRVRAAPPPAAQPGPRAVQEPAARRRVALRLRRRRPRRGDVHPLSAPQGRHAPNHS